MRIGLSTYSLLKAFKSGSMTPLSGIDWIARNGGEHVEVAPIGFDLTAEFATQFRKRAEDAGIAVSSLVVGANFLTETSAAYEAEVERVKRVVDLATVLGVTRMRHDVAWLSPEQSGIARFEQELPRMAEACQRIADYAASTGIVMSVENHGFFVQHSDRVLRLVQAVNRDNYRITLDVGNFCCVDEDPVAAVKKCMPYVSMVHVKDLYLRHQAQSPGQGWFTSVGGCHLRGAIIGAGDLRMEDLLRAVAQGGYDGDLSVEFEGLEDCEFGSLEGMKQTRRIWDSVCR
ncbi:MAG: sugar phosphate isomerase/epimerase [Firmicutes bacterium]|nr:sugar phosphate isomerase/epimerase [Bacillota bacterium]